MIPWKLTTDFNAQKHLFYNKIKTDYLIETYICDCGNVDFILKHSEQKIEYTCSTCLNDVYYDANLAWKSCSFFINSNPNLDFNFKYKVVLDGDTISSNYAIEIPHEIDFLKKKVIFLDKPLYTFSLSSTGLLDTTYLIKLVSTNNNDDEGQIYKSILAVYHGTDYEDYDVLNEPIEESDIEIFDNLKDNLLQYIRFHGCFNTHNERKDNFTLNNIQFFLKNKHLKDFDFYYWNDIEEFKNSDYFIDTALSFLINFRKEKSLKKALGKNYQTQLQENKKFYSHFIKIFLLNIEDINILIKFLKLKFDSDVYQSINLQGLEAFLSFLVIHYTDKQLLNLFNSSYLNNNVDMLRDSINQYSYSKEIINNRFIKVKCNLGSIHDELLRCEVEGENRLRQDKKLSYSPQNFKKCISIDNYDVKLPLNAQELFEWANALHNCLTGYFYDIEEKDTIIYGFFVDNILQFAVEIREGKIIQQGAKYNRELTNQESRIVTRWFRM